MKHAELLNQFREELSRLRYEVEASAAMGHFDVNKISEDVVCGVFKALYGFVNLRNLNEDGGQNYPGIDLADDEAGVAIQVTSDKTLDKVKDSLGTFIRYGLHEKYDRIIFYILTRKQDSYSAAVIKEICDEKVAFDVTSDILDFTDLATRAATADPHRLKQAADVLGAYMRGCDVGLADRDFDPPDGPMETLTTNLLSVYFPSTLYLAELLPDVLGRRRKRYQRSAVGDYVRSADRSVPSDYEVSANKLITFHRLEDRDNPFSFLVDEGTVEPFAPEDYYSIDEDHQRVFKSLLRFCLQQKLYGHRVLWKFKERMFIFLPLKDADNARKITWTGKKQATRTVFERKFNRKHPEKVLSTRHFGFAVSFVTAGDDWYVSITPEWFFSHGDSYQKSIYGDKLISGLKRMEKNRSVFDQVRFLCAWLNDLDCDDLFDEDAASSPQLTFGQQLDLDGGPYLNEDLWEALIVLDDDEQARLALP